MDITKTYAGVAFFFPVLISSSPVSILSPPTSKVKTSTLLSVRDRECRRSRSRPMRVKVSEIEIESQKEREKRLK
uniref:Uncharacterized protein n=1 Tax=Fagus sylvatica TaxID=28930 RepID=A0A2N9GZQ3_FAGSY